MEQQERVSAKAEAAAAAEAAAEASLGSNASDSSPGKRVPTSTRSSRGSCSGMSYKGESSPEMERSVHGNRFLVTRKAPPLLDGSRVICMENMLTDLLPHVKCASCLSTGSMTCLMSDETSLRVAAFGMCSRLSS